MLKLGGKNMYKRYKDSRLWLGIGIILLGLLMLADHFGFILYEIRRYIFHWEVILIFLGIVFIASHGKRSTGIVLLIIGGILYVRHVLHYDFTFWQIFWPSLCILAGFMILFRHSLDRNRIKDRILFNENAIDEIAFFGGGDRMVSSQQFQGGRVTAIFGGLNYNMLKAKLAPGENAIDIFFLFGGVKMTVPEDWIVKIKVQSFFGGFNDKRNYKIKDVNPDDKSPRLLIQGTVIFGGGEIKSYPDS